MEEQELKARDFIKDKEYDKAAKLYLQLSMSNPETERYLISAANCYDNLGDKKLALSLYKKALTVNENSFTALLNLSTLYYELKKYEKTILFAAQALQNQPNNFAAILNIGNAHYAMGEYAKALTYYEKLYNLNPNAYNAILNIANTCYNLEQYVRAIEYAEMAIEKRPASAEGYIIAGNSYMELLKNDEAAKFLKTAAEISPDSDWLCNSLAYLFQKMGNWKQCLHYAWKAFALKGQNAVLGDHINFAYFLYEAQDNEKNKELVRQYLKKWEDAFPQNPVVHHATCALCNVQEVSSMDLSYVKGLFDGFAPSFDEILGELNYRVPELIAVKLKDYLKTKLFKKRRILDLGCGTGLCGKALKTYFPNEEFYGVDISEKMLQEAEKKKIYKELYADDILNFTENNTTLYHAVIAGDVLTYLGDLKPIFRALTKTVKFQGYFAFSISKNTLNNSDYFLTPSGRFIHALTYIMRLLKYCGFKALSTEETVLRMEGDKEVIGYVIIAQKELEVVFE